MDDVTQFLNDCERAFYASHTTIFRYLNPHGPNIVFRVCFQKDICGTLCFGLEKIG